MKKSRLSDIKEILKIARENHLSSIDISFDGLSLSCSIQEELPLEDNAPGFEKMSDFTERIVPNVQETEAEALARMDLYLKMMEETNKRKNGGRGPLPSDDNYDILNSNDVLPESNKSSKE